MLFDWLIRVYIDSVVANILFPILPKLRIPAPHEEEAKVQPPEAAFNTCFVITLLYTCSIFIHCLCVAMQSFHYVFSVCVRTNALLK